MNLKKISVREFISQDDILSKKDQKSFLGGYGDSCWNWCQTYNGENTIPIKGTCYDAYHACNSLGYITLCGC